MMFPAEMIQAAELVSSQLRGRHLVLATAESCTGGLISGLITELAGSSDVLDRGFVTYSNEAKHELLDVPSDMIVAHGAVSEPVARAMATGALIHSNATVSIAVTGVAGPGGGSLEKPVGLVHIASAMNSTVLHRAYHYGPMSRSEIRLATIASALELVGEIIAV